MKQENFILSMLISDPESPGDAIDVYLQSLIEKLKELQETRMETFDASTRLPLMTFQHMQICQDGVPKEKWLIHVAIKKYFQLG